MKQNETGFTLVEFILIIVVLALVGFVGYKTLAGLSGRHKHGTQTANTSASNPSYQMVRWSTDGNGNWLAVEGQPPACPTQPMFKAPADLSKVTSILYPGQTRGGDYKPHGGFRFDNIKNNEVTVTAPLDGYVYRGARYLVNGETQYMFDVINSCGVMYRVGHLLTLDNKYQELANQFPVAQEGDSRTTNVSTPVAVKAGERIATKVGTTIGGANTFFDFGVYDLRSDNPASKDPAYVQQHGLELAGHAVCWLKTWLPTNDETKINSLPAGDPTSGKHSDYCG